MGPKPPAFARAQRRSASPMRSRNGAEMPCKKRIVSMPRRMTSTLRSQKKIKQIAGPDEKRDRKSTRLNSSHITISYAVFCLKKKKKKKKKKTKTKHKNILKKYQN